MKRYSMIETYTGKKVMIIDPDGDYCNHSEAQAEIEKRDKQISLLLKINEQDDKENEYLHQEIEKLTAEKTQIDRVGAYYRADYVKGLVAKVATLSVDRDTAMSMLGDAEARALRQKEEISALKSSLNCGDLCAEVTELKAENEKIKKCWEYKAVIDLETKLSRLTAMIEDDEAAEKAAHRCKILNCSSCDDREQAINDYRAMLLEAVKEKEK
jgi:hypothetical protein